MCGIFIVINKKSQPLNLQNCKRSLKQMHRRGPDWSFYKLVNKNIFIGQVVLSMTGEKKKNLNLHYSQSGNFFIVFNGEIYNYKSLVFSDFDKNKTKNLSDTNVLVNLFDFNKIDKINSILDGMYAFVVYDKHKKQLLISRDPQGEKSLYVYENNNTIIVSSEINPIISYTKDNEINFDIIKTYFCSRHFLQFEKTIFKNIKNIKPGVLTSLDLKNFKFKTVSKYLMHDLIDEKIFNINEKRDEDDLCEELDFLLEKNLKEMIPIGRSFASIISGGIDSSLISNYICRISNPKKIIYLNHIGKDKFSHQMKIFENYLNRSILKYKINPDNYQKNLIKCLKICNSPINSHDFVGKFILSKKIRQYNCRALFGGDGADELFGGYETYRQSLRDPKVNHSAYTRFVNPKIFDGDDYFNFFKKKLNENWKNSLKSYSFVKNQFDRNRLAMMLMDSTIQLSSVGLRGCDLMSMYHSVETRSVFLRKDIIKFALNLPLKFKINLKKNSLMSTKILLKKIFLKYYPRKLILEKQGFPGFPNEMSEFLGPKNKYIFKDILKIKNFTKKIGNSDKATSWKIYNTEMYFKNLPKLF